MKTNQFPVFRIVMMSTLLVAPAVAGPVLQFTSGSPATFTVFTGGVGWSFNTNQAITVVALDTWKLSIGPTTAVTVRLYDGALNILASAVVGPSDPLTGSPSQFYSRAITPVNLAAGVTYYIAQDVSQVATSAVGLVTDPAITYLGGLRSTSTVTPLTDSLGGAVAPAYFGPNFEIASVPEPGTLYAFAFGLAGLAIVRNRRR